MFEGKPPVAPSAPHHAEHSFADAALHAVSWGDLVARLSAARDLRSVLAQVPETARASFDGMAAEYLAAVRGQDEIDGKQPVNPVASGNGKEGNANNVASAPSASLTDQGPAARGNT